MAQVYKKTGTCSRPDGAQTDYPMYLVVGESANAPRPVSTHVYPPAHNSTYVKATSYSNSSYHPYFCTDPAKQLTGVGSNNAWQASAITNQRLHIDLGSAKVIRGIYYENFHYEGTWTNRGAKNFIMQGSAESTAFAETTYATDTNWTQIGGSMQFDEHAASDTVDPKYIAITNSTAYRYIALKIADNWGGAYMGLRRIVLLTDEGFVHCDAHCKPDFGDIRFHDSTDAALDYMIDWPTLTGTTPNQRVGVWVAPSPETTDTDVIIKYGDAVLTDASDGAAVFSKYKGFESGNDGDSIADADGDWTVTAGTVEIDTAKKRSGTRSARVVDVPSTTSEATIAVTASDDIAIRMAIYKDTANNFIFCSHGNGTKRIGVRQVATTGRIEYYADPGAYVSAGVNAPQGAWWIFEANNFDWSAGTFDIYINDALAKSGATMWTSSLQEDIVRVYGYNDATSDSWIDDLIVRKYASPEPTWGTWGAEEAAFTPDKEATDSGTGAESSVISITSSDSGTGADIGYLYDPSVFWPAEGSDSGTGTDSSTAPEVTLPTPTDSGVGAEKAERFILFAEATISAYSLGGYLPTGSADTDWPDEFRLWKTDDYLGDPLIQEGLLSLTNSYTHVAVSLTPEAKSGTVSPCYLDDYYYRIHVVPNYIDLGQMLSDETHDITIWNAYFVPQTMTSVTEVSTDGIDLSEPVTIPYEFAPLEEVTYEASVTMNGPSTIGATVYFNFSALFADSTLYCMIVGSRVMIWLWMPREEFTEEMCWNTNVIQTRNGEQRIAYLDAPRQTYNFSFSLPSDRYSDVKSSVDKWAHGVWGLPIWKEHSTVSATAGASAIDFDTSCADYQEGGWAMLWESPDKATALLITTVRVDGIDIDPVLGDTYENAWIMPMQRAILPEGMEFTRTPGQDAAATASFLCNDTVDLSDTSPYPQYRGYDVVTNGHYAIDDLSERIIRPTTQIDNGQGPITVLETQDYTQFARTLGLWTETKEDLWALRQWLHARRGRQKPFWLPTYNQDFTLAATITALTTDIEITGGRALSVYGTFPCDFMMELTDGSVYYRRIVTATTAPGGNTTMSIDSAIGREVTRHQVVLWCFMDLVRFNSDAITLRHRNPYFVDASVPLMRVPE